MANIESEELQQILITVTQRSNIEAPYPRPTGIALLPLTGQIFPRGVEEEE